MIREQSELECPEDLTNFGDVGGLEICLWPDYDRFINTHTEIIAY